jgi:hypothetical protein
VTKNFSDSPAIMGRVSAANSRRANEFYLGQFYLISQLIYASGIFEQDLVGELFYLAVQVPNGIL